MLKVQVTQSEARLSELTPRLDGVRAAHRAAKGGADAARRAADAVTRDQESPVAEAARAASAEAISACSEQQR